MAEAKLVLNDALIAESLRRGKQAERQQREASLASDALNDNQPADNDAAGGSRHRNQFQRASGKDRTGAQHEGD